MALTRIVGKSGKKAPERATIVNTNIRPAATHLIVGKKVVAEHPATNVTVSGKKGSVHGRAASSSTKIAGHNASGSQKSVDLHGAFQESLTRGGRGAVLKSRIDRVLKESDEARDRVRQSVKVKVVA